MIINKDCLEALKEMESESVHAVVCLILFYGYDILNLWKNTFAQFVKKNLKSVFIKNATLFIVRRNVLTRAEV